MPRIDAQVALEVASHEGLVRQAYKDSVGVWTWAVGMTDATGHSVGRYIDNPASLTRCLEVFVWALERYAADVREAFQGRELTKEQFAAALSFHWNTGAIKRATWVKHFLAGDMTSARRTFMDWSKPTDIIPRRRKERDLFFNGKWSSDGTMTEYTRVTARHTPDWGSAKKVNIKAAMSEAIARNQGSAAPEPSIPTTPSKPPAKPKRKGLAGLLIAGLVALAGFIASQIGVLPW